MNELTLLSIITTVAVVLGVVSLHTQFILADSKSSEFIKFVYPIVVTACIILGFSSLYSYQGYATTNVGKDWEYLAHTVEGNKAWIIVKDKQNDKRMLRITVSEEDKEKLEQAGKASEQGKRMKFKEVGNDEPELISEVIDLSAELKKDPQ